MTDQPPPTRTPPVLLTQEEVMALKAKPMRPSFGGTYMTEEERDALCDNSIALSSALAEAREEIARLTADRDAYKHVATNIANTPIVKADYDNVVKAVVYEHERAEAAESRLREVQEERDALHAAVVAFLEKWELCLPAISSAFMMSHIHGARYNGPTLDAELDALREIARSAGEG